MNTGHDIAARREAAVRIWEPAAPAEAELVRARGGEKLSGGRWRRVEGPHLRTVRRRCPRNRTGVVGISLGHDLKRGKRVRVLWVNVGSATRKVYVDRIGPAAAWRRALEIRAEHERRVAAANALILAARERAEA
ncbi:hypothetical protein ASA1KI_21030 [Opitutales bacterium ASA1]|uniref:hypothetical protein n=1 Tax=Congregicoccus parvus TaxID=3081749 RepID=UPI002B2F2D6A|nr:hypothetical protein ASA1KI_21030 [Opitutales bacterium ASA1]